MVASVDSWKCWARIAMMTSKTVDTMIAIMPTSQSFESFLCWFWTWPMV